MALPLECLYGRRRKRLQLVVAGYGKMFIVAIVVLCSRQGRYVERSGAVVERYVSRSVLDDCCQNRGKPPKAGPGYNRS